MIPMSENDVMRARIALKGAHMTNWVADNLGGLGLPQYLSGLQNQANSYQSPYTGTEYVRNGALDYQLRLQAELTRPWVKAREMTAEDLGLTLLQGWALIGVPGWVWEAASDAPYSFWLGADTPKPIDIHDPRIVLVQP